AVRMQRVVSRQARTLFPYTTLFRSALAVERGHGRRVPGWECMTMATLCPVEGEGVPLRGRDDPLLVARAAAIWLAMSAHVVFKGSEEHTSELQSREKLVCRLLLEKK